MRSPIHFLFYLLISAVVVMSVAAESGKIPISTKSEAARKHFLEGRDLSEKLRGQDSLQHFQKAIETDPDFAIAYLNRSFAQPSTPAFFQDLNQAVSLSNKASEGEKLWILAVQAGANGYPAKQGEYFQKLATAYPDDERAHNLLGTFYFGQQDYDKAIGEYERAVEINPKFSPAYNLLGYAYRFQEKFDRSENAFRKYIDLIPNDPNPYDSYAELLMRIGRYDESIQNYQKALTLDSHFVNSYLGIATNLDFKGQHEGARKELQKLLSVARNDGERRTAHFAITTSYVAEGKPNEALAELEKQLALAKKLNDPVAIAGDLNTAGIILLESGKVKEARAKFDEALKTVKNSNQSEDVKKIAQQNHLLLLGRAAIKEKDFAAAESNRNLLLTLAEKEKNRFQIRLAHELAGMIALEKKEYDLAIAELKQSNLQDPYNLYRQAQAYQAKGDKANAKQTFQQVVDFNGLSNLNYAIVRSKAKQAISAQ